MYFECLVVEDNCAVVCGIIEEESEWGDFLSSNKQACDCFLFKVDAISGIILVKDNVLVSIFADLLDVSDWLALLELQSADAFEVVIVEARLIKLVDDEKSICEAVDRDDFMVYFTDGETDVIWNVPLFDGACVVHEDDVVFISHTSNLHYEVNLRFELSRPQLADFKIIHGDTECFFHLQTELFDVLRLALHVVRDNNSINLACVRQEDCVFASSFHDKWNRFEDRSFFFMSG